MKKHRLVDTCFWDDSYITSLGPSEKLIFMYLLTNPLTNICGVYQIQVKRIAFDTGLDIDIVTTTLGIFERDGKCVYRNGWIGIKNWLKHQNRSPKIESGIKAQFEDVPKELASYVQGSNYDIVSIPYPYPMDTISHLNSNSNPNSNSKSKPVSTPVTTAPTQSTSSVLKPITFDFLTGMWGGIPDEKVNLWANAYPALDIERELFKASAWLKANPAKKKKNYERFLVNWMAKNQERGGDRVQVRR